MTIACESCKQPFDQARATYSATGALVCPSCAANAIVADGAARAESAKAKLRLAIIVSVTLLIVVPGGMILAGLGTYVATGLIIVGVAMLMGARFALRIAEPSMRRSVMILALIGIVAIAAGVGLQGLVQHAPVH